MSRARANATTRGAGKVVNSDNDGRSQRRSAANDQATGLVGSIARDGDIGAHLLGDQLLELPADALDETGRDHLLVNLRAGDSRGIVDVTALALQAASQVG